MLQKAFFSWQSSSSFAPMGRKSSHCNMFISSQLSCYLVVRAYRVCVVSKPCAQTPLMKNGLCCGCILFMVIDFCHDQYSNCGQRWIKVAIFFAGPFFSFSIHSRYFNCHRKKSPNGNITANDDSYSNIAKVWGFCRRYRYD